jgi:hypothetical protein
LIGKYLYRCDVSEEKLVEIWTFKLGLGQGGPKSQIRNVKGEVKNEENPYCRR